MTLDKLPFFDHPDYAHLKEIFLIRWNETKIQLKETLTPEMVADVRQWRCGDAPDDPTFSWRVIAQLFAAKYPEYAKTHGILSGNQVSGILICETVMELLNQKPEEGWN